MNINVRALTLMLLASSLPVSGSAQSGQITNVNPRNFEDVLCNYARIYNAPNGGAPVLKEPDKKDILVDNLLSGTTVYVCDEHAGWYEVYYGPPNCIGNDNENGLPEKKAKTCNSGWVWGKWIDIISG